MTEKEIRKYLVRLNTSKSDQTIFKREISPNVEIAKVWKNLPKRSDRKQNAYQPDFFFFIKNENQEYVGAVLDMGFDLHWFVLPKFRKRGYLTNALKEAIIPYIFDFLRESPIITISISDSRVSYKDSIKVAKSLNFTQVDPKGINFELNITDFDFSNSKMSDINSKMSKERMEELLKNFQFHYRNLLMISNELEMTFDDDYLKDRLSNIEYTPGRIEDLFYNQPR